MFATFSLLYPLLTWLQQKSYDANTFIIPNLQARKISLREVKYVSWVSQGMAQQGLKPKSLPWNPAWAPWRGPQMQCRKRKEWSTKVQKVLLSLIITTIPWKITTSLNLWDRLGNFPWVTDKLLPSRNLFLLGVNTERRNSLNYKVKWNRSVVSDSLWPHGQ